MKLTIVGVLIVLIGGFVAIHDARFAGPILLAVGFSCILFGVLT